MGWALPIDQWAIEPLYCGDPANQSPAAFGIYRRTQHGWHRVSEKNEQARGGSEVRTLEGEGLCSNQQHNLTRPSRSRACTLA